MKKLTATVFLVCSITVFSQDKKQDSTAIFKKRVLESAEIDIISSYYTQDGEHASVTGGIGDETLADITTDIIVSLPLNDDGVLTASVGISAYTSASSGNLNPFDGGGGSPWVESSGASNQDVWANFAANYSHSSDDRNNIWSANIAVATEYDYLSIGFGGGYTKLFNEKNTEVGVKAQVYLDTWSPRTPEEFDSYFDEGNTIGNNFLDGVDVLDQSGSIINSTGTNVWSPINNTLVDNKSRNSYSVSLNFSQILTKKSQFSLFLDVVQQKGWLSNPMQRVYFGDRDNYYVGNAASIPNYTSTTNTDVFQLADDIERLPDTRFKIPIGMRYNHYINEVLSLRTYYRYYYDDWGINSHTASLELPIKLGDKFTLYPNYRYYQQKQADYFAPFEQNLSTQDFYTSDYDLSKFDSNQYGLGIKYADLLAEKEVFNFGLKSIGLRYISYSRSDGLNSGIISFGIKFVNK